MLLPVVSLLVAEHLGGAPVQLVQQQLRGVRPASQPPAARHGPGLAESATSDQCWCCVIYAGCPLRWEVKTGGVIIGKRRGVATALPGQKQSGQSLLSGAMVQPGGNNSPALHWVTDSQGQPLAILLPFFLLPQLS